MHENEKNVRKRNNHPEITESKSSRFEHRICDFHIPASTLMNDGRFLSIRGIDFFVTAHDYTECVENQGHTCCGPFLCTTFGEFFFKDFKQNVRRFRPTQKVSKKRHNGVPDKIGHLLQTLFTSQIISIVLVPSFMGISTKDLEIRCVHVDTDLIIKTMGTEAKRPQIYYVWLERSAERFFAQVGLDIRSLQTLEADTKLLKLDFLGKEKLRKLLKINSGLMCTLEQLAKLLRNRSSYSKSGYFNVKRLSNNEGQQFCCRTEEDGKFKNKADSRKPAADEYEIHCASPLHRVGQQLDNKGERVTERICAQHDSSEKSKKSHPYFDEKQITAQIAQLLRESGSSAHDKAAGGNDQDFISCEQEPSVIFMDICLTTKSQQVPGRQSGHHFDTNADGGDWQRAGGIKTNWLQTQTHRVFQPSPQRQAQSMPPHCRHQRSVILRKRMRNRNLRVASLVHLLPKDEVKDMADAGLYLDEQAGLFCCPDCNLQVRQSQWPWKEKPKDVHRRQSPDCPAVNPAARAGLASPVTERGTERGGDISVGAGEQRHLSSQAEKEDKGESLDGASSMRDGEDETTDITSEREREGHAYTTSVKDKIKGQMHEAQEKADSLFTTSVEDELEKDSDYIPKIGLRDVSHLIPSNNDLQADCEAESSTPSHPSTGPDSLSS